jgi:ferrous iron transport protein A
VIAVALEPEILRWLAAIGIGRGDRVTVLRRAPFGGPIHLRTHTGGEFAVDRALARSIHLDGEVGRPANAEAFSPEEQKVSA